MKNKKNLKINLILSCLCFLCLFPKNLFAEIPQIKEEELKIEDYNDATFFEIIKLRFR